MVLKKLIKLGTAFYPLNQAPLGKADTAKKRRENNRDTLGASTRAEPTNLMKGNKEGKETGL